MATMAARPRVRLEPEIGSTYHYDPLRQRHGLASVQVVEADKRSDGWYIRVQTVFRTGLDDEVEKVLRLLFSGWIYQQEWNWMVQQGHLARVYSH